MVDEFPTLDTNGCDTSIGETWCAARQECHIESTDPCLPIEPVTEVPPYIPPIVVTPLVEYPPTPECVPLENKAWECAGMTNYEQYDRYDCIDGKITFVEHNSTVCGYPAQEPSIISPLPDAPAEGGIPVLYLIAGSAVLGIAALLLLRNDKRDAIRGYL
jgi:hypothetical protein